MKATGYRICSYCLDQIVPGDEIVSTPAGPRHARCDETAARIRLHQEANET